MINKEEEKYGGQEMDEYIYEVIAKNAVLPEIVVEGQTQTRYWPVEPLFMLKKRFLDFLPVDFCEMYCLSIQNVLLIIEMPGGMKGIEIDREDNDKKGDSGEDISMAR